MLFSSFLFLIWIFAVSTFRPFRYHDISTFRPFRHFRLFRLVSTFPTSRLYPSPLGLSSGSGSALGLTLVLGSILDSFLGRWDDTGIYRYILGYIGIYSDVPRWYWFHPDLILVNPGQPCSDDHNNHTSSLPTFESRPQTPTTTFDSGSRPRTCNSRQLYNTTTDPG